MGVRARWLSRLPALAALAGSTALTVYLGLALSGARERTLFLPGQTSSAHHQIELACESCHSRFGGRAALEAACVRCHGEQLAAVEDSHPRTKFTDPRNAERVALLDARDCTTCHVEHRPERIDAQGLTLPGDYCAYCHAEIGKERPSHSGIPFARCSESGCHNFHDNQALYEDFLVAHAREPEIRSPARVPARVRPADPRKRLAAHQHDAPAAASGAAIVAEWAASLHAANGVQCSECHVRASEWANEPERSSCDACHEREALAFRTGKHGMRLAAELPPMRPAFARLPMKADAATRELTCSACHSAHALDTRHAAVEACLECHDDAHSRAYEASSHAALWRAEQRGELPEGSGVSCATCHMPRSHLTRGAPANHDQSANLRPNEKMARTVCLACHGLQFTLDSLADQALVRSCFGGRPAGAVESIHWALERSKP